MNYGTSEHTIVESDGSIKSSIKVYNGGEVVKDLVRNKVRIKVTDAKDEMVEFMRFSDELRRMRENHRLVVLKDDPNTMPAFLIEYPKFNTDNSYFIILQWTELA